MAYSAETMVVDRHTYPDPFLDIASTKLPKSFHKLMELAQIFALTHPQISPIIQRLAEYPITSLTYKSDDKYSEEIHKKTFEQDLKIMEKLIEIGLDYYTYGNGFVSISFPFVRLYRCQTCKTDHQSHELKYVYDRGKFRGRCKKCRVDREFDPQDIYVRDSKRINIFRFEPQLITPKYNRVTGEYFFFYSIPADLKKMVAAGDKDILDSTPIGYLNAIRLKRKMRIKRIFHFKRPTVSGRDMQWGLPLVLPALKDAYLNQIYKAADEAIALEHSVPLRILFPQATSQDPLRSLSLGNFRQFMERNIRYWRRDKNAIITSPVPIASATIGGDGAAYSTIQARSKVSEEIMAAMMVTRGFVMGGENWSSASISQRVMENSFMNYLRRIDAMLTWIRDEVGAFMHLPPCQVSMKPFRKVDDVQMLQIITNLAQQKKISWKEALSRMDLNSAEEIDAINSESEDYASILVADLLAQNEANAKAVLSQTQEQANAQGFQQMMEQSKKRSASTMSEIQGQGEHKQIEKQMDDQAAQASQQQVDPAQAKAEKDQAAAAKDEQLAERYQREAAQQQQQQVTKKQITAWAQELRTMPEDQQKQMMEKLRKWSPDIADAVVAEASQPTLDSFMAQAHSPEDLASALGLIDPEVKQRMLTELRQRNPELFSKVAKILVGQAGAEKAGRDVVDMRPAPEKLPPRRISQ